MAWHGLAWLGMASHGLAWLGMAALSAALPAALPTTGSATAVATAAATSSLPATTRLHPPIASALACMAWLGMAWHGLAWLGMAWHGLAWLGMAWHGLVEGARGMYASFLLVTGFFDFDGTSHRAPPRCPCYI